MKDERNMRSDEIVDRAIFALRETPIPAGPPPETLQAVLAAGAADADRTKPKTIKERIFKMNRFTKVAAAIVIVAGIAGLFAWLTVGKGGTTIAWADVQEKIRNARTITFKVKISSQQPEKPEMEIKVMFMEPGLMRHDLIKPKKIAHVMILNMQKGKALILEEKGKKAVLIDLGLSEKQRKQEGGQDLLASVKELIKKSGKELDQKKKINGVPAKGYKVEDDKGVSTIWVNAKTGAILEMEVMRRRGVKMIMSDFVLNKKLDKKLFSLEVPKGYTLMKHKTEIKPLTIEDIMAIKQGTIEDVVEMLRVWTKARGGTFPEIPSPAQFVEVCEDVGKDMSDEEEGIKLGTTIARAMVLLRMHPEAHYAGKGVKLGDADKAVFWYKPKDSETYKVIYGDLSVKDVAKDDLPTTKPAAEPSEAPTEK